ncbi:MAG: hypothetical protein ACN2B6_09945 [Rickettsiales bacterium]
MADNHDRTQYATIGHPSVAAITEGHFRFASKKQAQEKLAAILSGFILSKKSKTAKPILWIKGFAITPEEHAEGCLGNFAKLSVTPRDDHYTVVAEKMAMKLDQHPQRKRPKRQHPDWGHPILRSVKKKRRYDDASEAHEELMRLHQDYPEISIPGEGQLHIIIYEPTAYRKKPIQKYTLKVKPTDDEKFVIQYRKNTYIKKKDPRKKKETAIGFFTSLVQKKRKK